MTHSGLEQLGVMHAGWVESNTVATKSSTYAQTTQERIKDV